VKLERDAAHGDWQATTESHVVNSPSGERVAVVRLPSDDAGMRLAVLVLLIACSSTPPPAGSPAPPSGSAASPVAPSGSATPYTGPHERGPCSDVHDCKLRDVCGCHCEGVLVSAPEGVACDESCPDTAICRGFTAICDLATRTCGAIPRAR